MKNNICKWFNRVGIILIAIGVWSIVFTHALFMGIVLMSFGYFLYLKND